MGLIDALAGGLEAASGGLAKIGFAQIEQDMAEQRQARMMEMAESIRQGGMKADDDFKSNPERIARDRQNKIDDATGVAQANMDFKAKNAKTEAQIDADKAIGLINAPGYLDAKRRDAAAGRAPEKASYSYQQSGDGRILQVADGKVMGYLKDPETGKDMVGKKDIAESTLAVAKSFFDEGKALEQTAPEKAIEAYQKGRDIIAGKAPGTQETAAAAKPWERFKAGEKESPSPASSSAQKETPKATAPAKQNYKVLSKAGEDRFGSARYNVQMPDGSIAMLTWSKMRDLGIDSRALP